jgi:recombination protein RecA
MSKDKESKKKNPDLKTHIDNILMGALGEFIVPTTMTQRLTTSWLAFNKFAPIEFGTSMLLYGPSQSGKSVMMMKLGASVQQMGGLFVCFNTEAANRDAGFLSRAVPELKYNDIAFYQPDTIEYVFDCINLIITNTKIDSPPIFIAVDSISACASKHELDTTMEKSYMEGARIAGLISNGLRQTTCRLSKRPIVLCLISQERENVGLYVKERTKPAGGRAAQFHASTTLYTRGHHALYRDEESGEYITKPKNKFSPASAKECSLELEKSRFSPGGNRMNYIIDYSTGISDYDGLFDLLLYQKHIVQSGSWYKFGEEKFYKKDFNEFFKNHPQLLDLVK